MFDSWYNRTFQAFLTKYNEQQGVTVKAIYAKPQLEMKTVKLSYLNFRELFRYCKL